MKRIKVVAGIVLFIMLIQCAAFSQSDIRVYVNGMRLDESVIINNDRTFIPLRAVGEAMGADVAWDEASRSVYVSFAEDDAIAQIVADVSPSVVTIIGNYDGSGATVKYNNPTMHGTGVVYKSNGYIVTNAHVVEDIKNLTVILSDGTSLAGNVLYSDADADLAVVKVDKLGLKPITMANKDSILSGKTAIAIGTPISLSMRNTVTKGIVSGNDVTLNDSFYKLIQTDASVNPGNSGGPLLNTKGELIGINSSKYASVGIDNMAFAIPVDTVQYAIAQFEQFGYIVRPQLGIELEQSWEAKIGIPTTKGVTVKRSENIKIPEGAMITAVNGVSVHSIADWNEAIKDTYNGKTLVINYSRGDATAEVEVEG